MISRYGSFLVLKEVLKTHRQLFCPSFAKSFAREPRQRRGLIRGAEGALFLAMSLFWKKERAEFEEEA